MLISQLLHDIETIEKNPSLYREGNFDERAGAIDQLEFMIIELLETGPGQTHDTDSLLLLKCRTEKIKTDLETINNNFFNKTCAQIREGKYTGNKKFRNLVNLYIDFDLNDHQETIGYDNLDIFINGLFPSRAPQPTKTMEPEMVFYQKTPARIVFELTEKITFTPKDVFIDIGSGLGQVPILVNLLTGVITKGIEYEPDFVAYANTCVAKLNLHGVTFLNIDARHADYSSGTIFFMFTPFKGEMLDQVLALLQHEALSRKITLLTYGPCTAQVALQTWLQFEGPKDDSAYKLAVFTSY